MKKLLTIVALCALAGTAFGQYVFYENDFNDQITGWIKTGGTTEIVDGGDPYAAVGRWMEDLNDGEGRALGYSKTASGETHWLELHGLTNDSGDVITNVALNFDYLAPWTRLLGNLASDNFQVRVDGGSWITVLSATQLGQITYPNESPYQDQTWYDFDQREALNLHLLDRRAIVTGLSVAPGAVVDFRFGASGGASGNRVFRAINDLAIFQAAPGDATLNRRVDIDDAQVLLGNWLATGVGWQQGDFTGDGTVNLDDASLLLGNWLAEYQPEANEATITLDTENMRLVVEANQIALIKITTSDDVLVPGTYTPAVAWTAVQQPTEDVNVAGEFTVSNTITGTATVDIAALTGLATLEYQILGQDPVPVTILIPEPATMALLGLGGLGVLLRRRRK